MKYTLFIIWVFAFAKAETSLSQTVEKQKIEQEFRIDEKEVPQKARDFIANFEVKKAIKWLQEEGADGTTIEAKFKSHGKRYSVEFAPDGALEDLEIVIGFSKIPEEAKQLIESFLKTNFDYYKIEKTQAQYQEAETRLLQWRSTRKQHRSFKPKFELVVKTRSIGEGSKRYEILFDENGNFIERSRVEIRSDNILRF